ncbi:hypothetical protein DIU31_004720 [Mucilaginibacter rubeus]|uniref:DUF7674 domain-containing protein n=1 Tax=Mucilaginibacter rubeus TaxID=2027860 RepID=A0AAE6JD32_9SPHI|nr:MULTISPECIES: hypothetical protein [Mucilaginibacter]QEM02850.1 hypothetical protein DIU31_004720 [Mucilaginibacter rubeus]QEM15468.1 hypothetical protein DIU38_004770 [Mucilaginibacter gossypii]QTE41800.1 hypothetical protein J3L19_23020 [Mucilaginibacter rubeus]QTE48404.1 hypothetical protein J3L21_23005 [Mucilaginibacter rubeus]QTE59791.1 hypothetical protein J3L23_14640 [Mucilaginibacter rubeus]
MSAWRKRAIECLPALKREFEDPETSIYGVFMELLHATIAAHRDNDTMQLKKNYDFAEWCFRQKSENLWNAAGVLFYEHLGDKTETLQAIHLWVKLDIYIEIRSLLKQRVGEATLKIIDGLYGLSNARFKG